MKATLWKVGALHQARLANGTVLKTSIYKQTVIDFIRNWNSNN